MPIFVVVKRNMYLRKYLILVFLLWSSAMVAQLDYEKYKDNLPPKKYELISSIMESLDELTLRKQADTLVYAIKAIERTSVHLALDLWHIVIPKYKALAEDSLANSYYAATAYAYMALLNFDQARDILQETEAYWVQSGYYESLAENHIKSGWLEYEVADYPKSLSYFYKAIAIYEKIDKNHFKLPDIYNRIGILYNTVGNYSGAYNVLLHAIERGEKGDYINKWEATIKYNILISMKKLRITDRYDEFLEYSAKRYLASSQPKSKLTGLELVISKYLASEDCDTIRHYLNVYDSISQKYDDYRFKQTYYTMRLDYLKLCQPQSSTKWILDSILVLSKILKDPLDELNINEKFEAYYKDIGRLDLAYQYRLLVDSVRNIILSEEKQNYISELEMMDIERKAKDTIQMVLQSQSIIEKRLNRRNKTIGLLIGILVAAIAIGLWIFNLYHTRNNYANQLTETNANLIKTVEKNNFLIKEIHHRVKNNLQVVSSLLNLQGHFESNEEVLDAIKKGKDRIQSISLLHKSLYNNDDLSQISVKPYVEEVIAHLERTFEHSTSHLKIEQHIEDFTLDIDTVLSMGLILNELITNAYKHGIKEVLQPKVKVIFIKEDNHVTLAVSDNGPGIPFTEIDTDSSSLGWQLIDAFTQKLAGKLFINNTNGTTVSISFDIPSINKMT